MPNSKQIVYLSQAQYTELITNGTITVDGVTVTYDENDIYVTPQAEPVTDVRVNGTSIAANGVANVPIANGSTFGVVKVLNANTYGVRINSGGAIDLWPTGSADIKNGTKDYLAVNPAHQHESAFYGLAKASGDTTQSQSNNAVGTYTPEAKGAIQSMLGVSDLIATAENTLVASKAYAIGDVFTANGKLYKVTTAIAANEAIVLQNEGETVSGANAVETKVGEGFVKFTDYATGDIAGAVKINANNGIDIASNGALYIKGATDTQIKQGTHAYKPIIPSTQHTSTFYGLAKAAGADEKDSTLPVGQYTDTAKIAIRSMLGATSSNVIAVQDIQPTDTDTKIWLPETAETPVTVPTVAEMNTALSGKVDDVQVNGESVVQNSVANVPVATNSIFGVTKGNINQGIGVDSVSKNLYISQASESQIKAGTSVYKPITPANQHVSTFYGLAKVAGDTTQAASDNAVGTYTDDAKSAIRTMLGAVGTTDYATAETAGIVKVSANYGITQNGGVGGPLQINYATAAQCKNRTGSTAYQPLTVFTENAAAFYGLAYAAGDTTMASSTDGIGVYTDSAKASIKAMLGIQDGSTGTVNVSGATPTITAVENTRYVCGEVTSLSFTPPSSGISIVRFTSGSTVTVLTIPSTVKFPEWFDPTTLETNTIYEICVTDGIYGAVMSWAQ